VLAWCFGDEIDGDRRTRGACAPNFRSLRNRLARLHIVSQGSHMQPYPRVLATELGQLLDHFPAVALTGPRQCGKTTLSRQLAETLGKPSLYLDLENTADRLKLTDPNAFLDPLAERLIILDEVQRVPDLFPQLRGIIDRRRTPGRFLLLGSASPLLLRQSSESLAGRIAHVELAPLQLAEAFTTGGRARRDASGNFFGCERQRDMGEERACTKASPPITSG